MYDTITHPRDIYPFGKSLLKIT